MIDALGGTEASDKKLSGFRRQVSTMIEVITSIDIAESSDMAVQSTYSTKVVCNSA